MPQFSVRLADEQSAAVRRLAALRGRSVNQTFADLVDAATDPSAAGDDRAVLRERLARAGLAFDERSLTAGEPPDADDLAAARTAAGRGTPLSALVAEGRR